MVLFQCVIRFFTPLPVMYWLYVLGGSLAFFSFWRFVVHSKNRRILLVGTVLVAYMLYVVFSSVMVRASGVKTGVETNPFWIYEKIIQGEYYWPEIVGNILLGVPIGFLSAPLTSLLAKKGLWQAAISTCIGFLFSVVIELLQLLTQRGLADMGDVFHNTLGAMIGALIYILAVNLQKSIREKPV